MELVDVQNSKIQVYSGRAIDPLDVDPELIAIEDIAHHLGNQCRYTGAVAEFYSVAQHSVLCSYAVEKEFAYAALMHDAAEYLLGDVARPLKHSEGWAAYRAAEERVQEAIAHKFQFEYPDPSEVKQADALLYAAEVRDLLGGMTPIFQAWVVGECEHPKIKSWSPRRSRKRFLARYHQLAPDEVR